MDSKANKSPVRGTRFQRYRVARIMAVQAVYEANYKKITYLEIQSEFIKDRLSNNDHPIVPEKDLFTYLLTCTMKNYQQVYDIITKSTVNNWKIKDIDPVLLAILQIGISELLHPYKNTPKNVIISEYVEIGKGFLSNKEAGYINKVLDHLGKT